MAEATKKQVALGTFYMATGKLDSTVGGRKKLQQILGRSNFYEAHKKWFYNNEAFKKMSTAELDSLTKKIKAA